MKEFRTRGAAVRQRIERANALTLLLDFDGTLSPIVPRPEDAYLPARTRRILKKMSRSLPVCIITGRPLRVIQKKMGIPGLYYGASHGLELSLGRTLVVRRIPRSVLCALADIRAGVRRLRVRYPRLINEPKPFAVTFHYHLLSKLDARLFEQDITDLFGKARKYSSLRVFRDKKTVDIVPSLNWTKGDAARFILRRLAQKTGKRSLPIYIGDSGTDEDAFRALKKGITIRVGNAQSSAAQYYFRNRREVDLFLFWLAAHCKKQRR